MKKEKGKKRPVTVGGQAVMEGVMMQGPEHSAIAVRRSDGKIVLHTKQLKKIADKYPILGWPIIRGVVNFVVMLMSGMKTITESADMAGLDIEEPSKAEKKIAQWLHMKPNDVMMLFAVILAIVLAVGLFFVLPTVLESFVKRVIENRILINIAGGVIRIAVFLTYLLLVSRLKEIKRVFQYHGAEHKTVFCFENNEPLTVENVRKYSTLHPRCGTSFLVIVMIISIFIFTLMGTNSSNVLMRVLSRLALLPLVAGISYEALRWLGWAENNVLVRLLKWPGLMTQKITTAEPDDSMIEVAIVSLKAALKMPNPLPQEDDAEYADAMAKAEADAEQTSEEETGDC